MREISLLSIATAVPENVIEQSKVESIAAEVFPGLFNHYPVMIDIFRNSGIERRHTVRPLEWYLQPRDWNDRSKVFHEDGLALFERVAKEAIARANIEPRKSTALSLSVRAALPRRRWRRGRPKILGLVTTCGACRYSASVVPAA